MQVNKRDNKLPNINGSHYMNWRELAEADDYATSLIVDPFLGFKTHKMTNIRIHISERIRTKLRNTIIKFNEHKDYNLAFSQIMMDEINIKRSFRKSERFQQHVYRYLLLFDDRSGIQIRPCWRYSSEGHVGAAIFATKDWPKGCRIDSLVGCIAELNYEDEVSFLRHKQNDFSVMYSSRKNRSQLWLGPAAYVNHDCQPNCVFTINCDGDARMSLEVRTDIKKGDEIFIFYGKNFFETNNMSCECFTCELLGQGYFSQSKFNHLINKPSTNGRTANTPTSLYDSNNVDNARVEDENVLSKDGLLATIRHRLLEFSLPNRGFNGDRIFSEVQLMSPDSLNIPPTPASMNGILTKGMSTGLARKVTTTCYSLRHTGSRLNRVKERIYTEMAHAIVSQMGPIFKSAQNLRKLTSSNDDKLARNDNNTGSVLPLQSNRNSTALSFSSEQSRYTLRNRNSIAVCPKQSNHVSSVEASSTKARFSMPERSKFPCQLKREKKSSATNSHSDRFKGYKSTSIENDVMSTVQSKSHRFAPTTNTNEFERVGETMSEKLNGISKPQGKTNQYAHLYSSPGLFDRLSEATKHLSFSNRSTNIASNHASLTEACGQGMPVYTDDSSLKSIFDFHNDAWIPHRLLNSIKLSENILSRMDAQSSHEKEQNLPPNSNVPNFNEKSGEEPFKNYNLRPRISQFSSPSSNLPQPALQVTSDISFQNVSNCSPRSSSSSDTFPAVIPDATPPRTRILLVCKRSTPQSENKLSSEKTQWFVQKSPLLPTLTPNQDIYEKRVKRRCLRREKHRFSHPLFSTPQSTVGYDHGDITPTFPYSSPRSVMSVDRKMLPRKCRKKSRLYYSSQRASLGLVEKPSLYNRSLTINELPQTPTRSSCLSCYSFASPTHSNMSYNVNEYENSQQSSIIPDDLSRLSGNTLTPIDDADDTEPGSVDYAISTSPNSDTSRCCYPLVINSYPFVDPPNTYFFQSPYICNKKSRKLTSSSSLSNTPSPPQLQPATPQPPILREQDTELSSVHSFDTASECVGPPLYSPLTSRIENIHFCLQENTLFDTVDVKPLTVTIKRLGQKLYCIPSCETENTS